MADIIIQDSGYISPTNTGTRATAANMANSGNAITLHASELMVNVASNLDTSPALGVFATGTEISAGADINLASIENVGFTIKGVLDLGVTTDLNTVIPLLQIGKTKWYKLLYVNDTTETDWLLYQLSDDTFTAGEVTAFGLSAAYKHVHVMVKSIQLKNVTKEAERKVTYTITGFITKKGTSSI